MGNEKEYSCTSRIQDLALSKRKQVLAVKCIQVSRVIQSLMKILIELFFSIIV